MEIVFQKESKNAAYKKMRDLGFGNAHGTIGFTNFSVQKNVGLEDFEIYQQEVNNRKPQYAIVCYSNYHSVETIEKQYKGLEW